MDWQQIILFAILGLGAGSLIAGIAIGIVLTYRGSGIINLATGGMAMFAGYAFWALTTDLLHALRLGLGHGHGHIRSLMTAAVATPRS